MEAMLSRSSCYAASVHGIEGDFVFRSEVNTDTSPLLQRSMTTDELWSLASYAREDRGRSRLPLIHYRIACGMYPIIPSMRRHSPVTGDREEDDAAAAYHQPVKHQDLRRSSKLRAAATPWPPMIHILDSAAHNPGSI